MSNKKKLDLDHCKTGRDFVSYAEHHDGGVDHQCGSHAIVKGPTGGTCPVPMHPGDIPTGTRHSIMKRFVLIGLAGAVFVLFVLTLL